MNFDRIVRYFIAAFLLYLGFHIASWYGRHVERTAVAETLLSVNSQLLGEGISRFSFRISEAGYVSLSYGRPTFKKIKAAAAKAGQVQDSSPAASGR